MAENEKNGISTVTGGIQKGVKATSGFIGEFKDFISRGNVVDMAVGMIIGAAFTAIVSSLVSDILTPVLSLLTQRINFSDLKIVLAPATEEASEVAIAYGSFIQSIITFIIQAFAIFVLVKMINKVKAKAEEEKEAEEAEAAEAAEEPVQILKEIRDVLQGKVNKEEAPEDTPEE